MKQCKLLVLMTILGAWFPSLVLATEYYPDYTEANQGSTGNGQTVKAYVDTIGANSATIVFRHSSGSATTTYIFSTAETIPANIKVTIEKGAIISISNGVTLTINGSFDIGLYSVFGGAGSINFGGDSITRIYPEWWGIDGTNDEIEIQKANDAANGREVFLANSSYNVSDLTIDNCTLNGRAQEATVINLTGTIDVQNKSTWGIYGRLHNLTIKTPVGYDETAVRLTGFLNRESFILNNLKVKARDETSGSVGILLEAVTTGSADIKAIASSTFGPIIVEGYEYGVKLYANGSAGGTAFINANQFQSLKIFDSVHLMHIEQGSSASVNNGIYLELFLQGGEETVDALYMKDTQKNYIKYNFDGGLSSSDIILEGSSWFNTFVGCGIGVDDSAGRNRFISTESDRTSLISEWSTYGSLYNNKIIMQPDTCRYLLLAQKLASQSIVGTITGRNQHGSSAGENSARIYINILSDNINNTYSYWEIDSQAIHPTIVELTYNGNTWIALDAVATGSTTPLRYAVFEGQYTAATDQLTWVEAGDVSNVTSVYSTRKKTAGNMLEGSASWNPNSITSGAMESKDITVSGAALGDFAVASFSLDVENLILNAQVTADNTVTCILVNNTGAAINLDAGTVRVKVTKK